MLDKRRFKFFFVGVVVVSTVLFLVNNVISDELAILPAMFLVIASFPWSLIVSIIGEIIFVEGLGYDAFSFASNNLNQFFTSYFCLYINIYILVRIFVKKQQVLPLSTPPDPK